MAKAKPIVGLSPNKPILDCARLIVTTRLGEMLEYEPFLEKVDHVFELHQMRIAAKRLRYTMDIWLPLYNAYSEYGEEFEKAIGEIKELQEHLGEIHDADVLVPTLEEHLARLLKGGHGRDKRGELRTGVDLVDLEGCQGLLTLCRQIRDERSARYRKLLDHWHRLREARFFDNLGALLQQAAAIAAEPRESAVAEGASV